MPEIDGLNEFSGEVLHVSDYKSGERFKGKNVLVVGCGNSGMEVSLDLCNHQASPSMVVRSSVSERKKEKRKELVIPCQIILSITMKERI